VLDRAAARTSAAELSVQDIAAVVSDIIRDYRKEILKHVRRLHELTAIRLNDRREQERLSRVARRVTQLESEIRMLRKEHNGRSS